MTKLHRRKLLLAFVFAGACALAFVHARSSTTGSGAASKAGAGLAAKNAAAIGRIRESVREQEALDGSGVDSDSAAGEELASRAYPSNEVTFAERQAAIDAAARLSRRGHHHPSAWEFMGPQTLDVDRLGTQTYQRPTQWSGRVTALAVDPSCNDKKCTLYLAAAGGGVWRSKNALAPKPDWRYISGDLPTNAIGAITVDPTDPSGNTIYVGTGEANSSGDSEAGLGLYKSTDGGDTWSLVPGSTVATANRSIGGVAVDPKVVARSHHRDPLDGQKFVLACRLPPGIPGQGAGQADHHTVFAVRVGERIVLMNRVVEVVKAE